MVQLALDAALAVLPPGEGCAEELLPLLPPAQRAQDQDQGFGGGGGSGGSGGLDGFEGLDDLDYDFQKAVLMGTQGSQDMQLLLPPERQEDEGRLLPRVEACVFELDLEPDPHDSPDHISPPPVAQWATSPLQHSTSTFMYCVLHVLDPCISLVEDEREVVASVQRLTDLTVDSVEKNLADVARRHREARGRAAGQIAGVASNLQALLAARRVITDDPPPHDAVMLHLADRLGVALVVAPHGGAPCRVNPANAAADAPAALMCQLPDGRWALRLFEPSEGSRGPCPRSEGSRGPCPRSEGSRGPCPRSEGPPQIRVPLRRARLALAEQHLPGVQRMDGASRASALQRLRVPELQRLCRDAGVALPSVGGKVTKPTLVRAVLEAFVGGTPPPAGRAASGEGL
jgi:hypothetical protein